MIRLTIPGKLPGLNDYIRSCRNSKYSGNKMKSDVESRIISAAEIQMRGVRFCGPVVMHYTWIEPNRCRDKDNIAFAKKFVQDALVKSKILKNDGWSYIDHFTDSFAVDPKNPRVEVEITEAGQGSHEH